MTRHCASEYYFYFSQHLWFVGSTTPSLRVKKVTLRGAAPLAEITGLAGARMYAFSTVNIVMIGK